MALLGSNQSSFSERRNAGNAGTLAPVPKPLTFARSKLSPDELAVAARLREARKADRFTIRELAAECSINPSALKHYEQGAAPLPFGVGEQICERLNLNQRWLATGERPRFPFVFSGQRNTTPPAKGRHTFFEAYTGWLREPMERWYERARAEEGRIRTAASVILPGARQLSSVPDEALQREFLQFLNSFFNGSSSAREDILPTLRRYLSEYERRLKAEKEVDRTDAVRQLPPMQIGELVKAKRAELGLTQTQAAARWEIPIRALQTWEQGVRTPRGLALRQLELILQNAR
jgi:DNA-binding transcriptional regulator YiaG